MKTPHFLEDVMYSALIDFSEHLCKSWAQWQITKHPIKVLNNYYSRNDVAICTREDFREDIKFLCISERISTHHEIGIITMVYYPTVLVAMKCMALSSCQTQNQKVSTWKFFEELSIQYM